MVVTCESSTDIEIIVGTYEEFVLGYKALKTEDGHLELTQSFATHAHMASVRSVAGGGRFLASGGADDLIQLYDMKLRKEMGVLMHHDRTVTCLAFVGQSHLASGSDDGDIALWRTGSWQCEKVLSAHKPGGVSAIAVHPSGKLCLTSGRDRTLRTWNLVKGRAAYTTNLHAQVEALTWSPSGDHYAVAKLVGGGAQYSVDVYEVSLAGIVYSITPEHRPASICFVQDDVLAVGTDGGKLEMHSISTKSRLCSMTAHQSRVRCLDAVHFSSGDMWLVTASSTGDIAVWKYKAWSGDSTQMAAPKQLGSVTAGCRVTSLALVVAPVGAVECKVEKPIVEMEEKVEIKPATKQVQPQHRGRVIIELEDSDEDPPVKKHTSQGSKNKGGKLTLQAKKKRNKKKKVKQ